MSDHRTTSQIATQHSALSTQHSCFVLHGHLPYARRQGQWPHGEEWIHEAASTTYIPLLDRADRSRGARRAVPPDHRPDADPDGATGRSVRDRQSGNLSRRPPAARRVGPHPLRAAGGEPRGAGRAALRRALRRGAGRIPDALQSRHRRQFRRLASLRPCGTDGQRGDARLPAAARPRVVDRGAVAGRHRGVHPPCWQRAALDLAAGVRLSPRAGRPPRHRIVPGGAGDQSLLHRIAERRGVAAGGRRSRARRRPSGPTASRLRRCRSSRAISASRSRSGRAGRAIPAISDYREFHRKDAESGLWYWRITGGDVELGEKDLYDPDVGGGED